MFFRSWAGADEAEGAPAPRAAGLAGAEPSVVDGQDLDVPTYLRLNLRIDPA